MDFKKMVNEVKDFEDYSKEEKEKVLNKLIKGFEKGLLVKHILKFPDSVIESMYSTAYNLYNLGQYEKAQKLFQQLIMLDYTDFRFSFSLAATMHMLKDYEAAIKYYMQCYILERKNPVPYYQSIDCHIQLGELEGAQFAIEQCIKICGKQKAFAPLKEQCKLLKKGLDKQMKDKKKNKKKKKKTKE
jgi:type III secretion system low calcium response chaperone LcrH/SycD